MGVIKYANDLSKFMKRPFVNLNNRAKILFALRFFSSLILFITLATLLSTKFRGNYMYIARIDCKRQDLANGLFSALQTNFKISNTLVTTSEIKLLAQYTENKVRDTPEVIYAHLEYSCYKQFDTISGFSFNGYEYDFDESDNDGDYNNQKNNTHTITCEIPSSHYTLDYRKELSQIGLNIILAYAYDADFSFVNQQNRFSNNVVYKPSIGYENSMVQRRKQSKICLAFLKISLALNALMTVGCVVYYGLRPDGEKDDSGYSFLWKNIVAGFSSFLFISVLTASLPMLILVVQMQKSVKAELSSFGIKLKLGPAWFGVLWFSLGLSFLLFLFWGGVIWCNNDVDDASITKKIRSREDTDINNNITDTENEISPLSTVGKYDNANSKAESFWNSNPDPFVNSENYIPLDDFTSINSNITDDHIISKSPIGMKTFFHRDGRHDHK